MIYLSAIKFADGQLMTSGEKPRLGYPTAFAQPLYSRTFEVDRVRLCIAGDSDLAPYCYSDPGLVLILNADLSAPAAKLDGSPEDTPAANIARMYRREGDLFARRLHGTFAVILWDRTTQELKAWTDQFGTRRILYESSPDRMVVSTDLRLLSQLTERNLEIDHAALLEYVQHTCILAPRTIYRHVHRLEPGHWLNSRNVPSARPYWIMTYEEDGSRTEAAWEQELYEAIREAVARNTHSPESGSKMGAFLSGGTDSSSVVGLLGDVTASRPLSFSIGFDDPRYNEVSYARIAASRFNTDHNEYFVTPQDILDLLERAADAYDEPFANSSIIPAYFCSRLARERGVTHLLAGDGGDELFGGNQRYADDEIFARYGRLPAWLRRGLVQPLLRSDALTRVIPYLSRGRKYVRRASLPLPDRLLSYSFLSSTNHSEVFTEDFLNLLNGHDPLEPVRRHFHDARAACDLNRWLYMDLRITINDNDIRKVTCMADLAGVVPRYPLLDPALVEFSGKIPANLKVRGRTLRYLFKKAMSRILPPEIIHKKKHGFGLPYSIWLGEHRALKEFTFDVLTSSQCMGRGYFRPDLARWLWDQYQKVSRVYYGDVLWIFLMLELWHIRQAMPASGKKE
jgi:asparagine synthase (glutamine-hydrolysing)